MAKAHKKDLAIEKIQALIARAERVRDYNHDDTGPYKSASLDENDVAKELKEVLKLLTAKQSRPIVLPSASDAEFKITY